jgi:mutator protein MutT
MRRRGWKFEDFRISGFEDLRDFPTRPAVGVGAVVIDGNSVLLVKRGHAPLKGEWSLPGGAVEIGETLEAALIREVREETGLAVAVGPLVEVFDRIERAPDGRVAYHFVIVDFACTATAGEVRHASDADDARWVAVEDLALYNMTPKATAVIHRALELTRGRV